MAYARVVQVTIHGRMNGNVTNNVLNFGTNGINPNYVQLCLDIIDCIFTALRSALGDAWSLEKLSAREIFPALADPIDVLPVAATQGTGLPPLPSFSCYLVNLYTGGGGRKGRGKMFLPSVIANSVNGGVVNNDTIAKIVVFLTCMAGKFINQPEPAEPKQFQWGVLSRVTAGANNANAGAALRPITAFKVNPVVAVQRRRKNGVGV
jgi:hypothetical protein